MRAILQLVETVVDTALREQVAMRTHLNHAALVKNDDPIHVLNR